MVLQPGYLSPLKNEGSSGTPLIQKLGIKPGLRMAVVRPPESYFSSLGPLPTTVQFLKKPTENMDFLHLFTKSKAETEKLFPGLKKALSPAGMLWVSWPKAASKMPTDLNDNVVRNIGLKNGLLDIKVCAVDEVWSGLKFVIPVKDREKVKK